MDPKATLLAWYDRCRRDLPWRESRDPWRVWVSEVMLQQTRVETVIPYFERFLARFPGPAALAAATVASDDEALALWSGLGYYRRARQLAAAARALAAEGRPIPATAAELARLPGVGPYTAAAIASIAFGEAVPVLDGNVARLLARYSAEAEPVASRGARGRLLALGATLVDPARPGDSNQAMMELGATLCLPRAPRCSDCPLSPGCRARALAATGDYPRRARRPAALRVRQVAAVVEREGRLLLFRRGDGEARLAGLWELPLVEAPAADGSGAAAAALARRFGGRWRLGEPLAKVRHAITTSSFEIVAHRAELEPAADEVAEGREAGWFARHAAAALALSGATRKLLAKLEKSV